jgi:hypothetical protein
VLSALPTLKNLDGERNPTLQSMCFSRLLDATAMQKEVMQFEPDFSFAEPEPWFNLCSLQVPDIPGISHYHVVNTLHERLDKQADWLAQEVHKLAKMTRAWT